MIRPARIFLPRWNTSFFKTGRKQIERYSLTRRHLHLWQGFLRGLLVLVFFLACGCKKKPVKRQVSVPKISQPVKKTEVKKAKKKEEKKQKYVYRGSKFRNPFIPSHIKGKVVEEETGVRTIDISTLKLTGIMIDSKKRGYAIIIDPGRENYVLKGGKLIDNYGKTVPGIAGIIKKDRVIILAGKGKIKELRLREEEKK